MAYSSRALLASLLVLLLLLATCLADHSAESQMLASETSEGSLNNTSIDCGGACAVRCALSSRPNLCKRACGTCCARCNCVPPGTYGNYESCPCYAQMTTHGGQRKCP